MIKVEKIKKASTLCESCGEKIRVFRVKLNPDKFKTHQWCLCEECVIDLSKDLFNIYLDNTTEEDLKKDKEVCEMMNTLGYKQEEINDSKKKQ